MAKLVAGFALVVLLAGIAIWTAVALRYQEPAPEMSAGSGASVEGLWTHSFAAASGGQLRLADLPVQAVVVDFWATWCTPCHVQAEVLREIYPSARAKGVEFVGVALGEERSVVEGFLARKSLPYPVLFDPESESERYLSIPGLPKILVLDRSGRIVFERTGLVDRAALERALETVLAS